MTAVASESGDGRFFWHLRRDVPRSHRPTYCRLTARYSAAAMRLDGLVVDLANRLVGSYAKIDFAA